MLALGPRETVKTGGIAGPTMVALVNKGWAEPHPTLPGRYVITMDGRAAIGKPLSTDGCAHGHLVKDCAVCRGFLKPVT